MADSTSVSWEAPSLPMIALALKETQPASFSNIKPFIESYFGEDGSAYSEEIKQMDQLRAKATKPARDHSGISVLRRYSGQLCLLKSRFSSDRDLSPLPLEFRWRDVYTGVGYQQEGFTMEQASILYNMGALHSILGSKDGRRDEQEMKEACTHFQCAAGAMVYLLDNFGANYCKDIGPELVGMYKSLMLAQAQECLIEKSTKGEQKPKPGVVARLASKVSEMYSFVVTVLESEVGGIVTKKHKDWTKLCQMKGQYYMATAYYFQGEACGEAGRFGEKVAYLQSTAQQLKDLSKQVKSLPDPAKQAVKWFNEHAMKILKECTQLNESVYHDLIPGIESLEPVQPVELVKPVVFKPTDPSSLGSDIFGRLVPMRAYEAASVYSEEKAKLLRSTVSSVEEADETLDQYMQCLKIEELDNVCKGPPPLPPTVIQHHNTLKGKDIKQLKTDMEELMQLQMSVSGMLNELDQMQQDSEGLPRESPVVVVLGECWKDSARNKDYHSQACQSNLELKHLLDKDYQNFILLHNSLAAIQASVPVITLLDRPDVANSDAQRLREILVKVDEMKSQRKTLVAQLRDRISQDDIVKSLLGHPESSQESLFEEHMKPHRDVAGIIRQNLAAQDNILLALTEANAKHSHVREAAADVSKSQQEMFQALEVAGNSYPVIVEKLKEGLTFYRRLSGNVTKLRDRVREVLRQHRASDGDKTNEPAVERAEPSAELLQPTGLPPQRPPKRVEMRGEPLSNPVSPTPGSLAPHPSLLEGGAVNSLPPDLVQPYRKDTPGSSGDGGGAVGGASNLSHIPSDVSDIGNLLDLSTPFPSSVGPFEAGNPLGLPSFSGDSALGSLNLPPPVSSGEFDLIASGLNDLRPASGDAQEGKEGGMAEQQRPSSSLERRPDCVPDTLPEPPVVGETEAEASCPSAPQLPSFESLHPSALSEAPSDHITSSHSPIPTADHGQGNAAFAPGEDPSQPPGLQHNTEAPAHFTVQDSPAHPDVAEPAMHLSEKGMHQMPPYGGPPPSGRLSSTSVHFDSTHNSPGLPLPQGVQPLPSLVGTNQDPSLDLAPPTGPSQGSQPPAETVPQPIPPPLGNIQPQLRETHPHPPAQATTATQPAVAEGYVTAQPVPQYTLPPSATDKERDIVTLSRPEATLYGLAASEGRDQVAGGVSSGPPLPSVPHDSSSSFKQGLPSASVATAATSSEAMVANSMSPPTFRRHGDIELAPSPYVQEALVKQRREAEKDVAEMEEQRRQIAALQLQLSQQAKDKAESASNYQSILSLLQQQQPMVQQQQTFINQLQEQNELLRKKAHEQQMQYEQRLSQEQLVRDRLQQKIVLVHEEGCKKQKELTEQFEKLQMQSAEAQKKLMDQVKELTEKLSASEQHLAQKAQDFQQLQMQFQASMTQAHQAQQYVQQCQSELQEKGRMIEGLQVEQQQHLAAQHQWNVKEQKYKQELVQLQDSLEELKTGDRRHKEEIGQLKQQIQDLLAQLKGGTLPTEDASRHLAESGTGTQEGLHRRPTPPPTPSPAQAAPRPETPQQKLPSGDLQGPTANPSPAPGHTSLSSVESQGQLPGMTPHNPALLHNQQSMMHHQQQLMIQRPAGPQVQMMQPQPVPLTPAQLQMLRAQQMRMQQQQPGPQPRSQVPTAQQSGAQPSMQLRGLQPMMMMPTQPSHQQPLPQNPLDGSMPSTLALGKPLIPTPHSLQAQVPVSTSAPLYVGPKPVMTPQVVQTPGPGSLHGSPQFSTSGAIPPSMHMRATAPMGSQGSWASVPGQQFFGGQPFQPVPQGGGVVIPTSAITGQHIMELPGATSRPQFGTHRGQ